MRVDNATSNFYAATLRSQPATNLPAVRKPGSASSRVTPSGAAAALDFTNMSPQQLQSTMNSLINSGRLSFDDSSALVGMTPTALSKVNYDGQAPAAYNQPMNVLATLQAGIEGAQSRGDTANVESLTRALDALLALQGTPQSISAYA